MDRRALLFATWGAALIGCGDARAPSSVDAGAQPPDAGRLADAGATADAGVGAGRGLPTVRAADPTRAARGLQALTTDSFGGRLIPALAIRNLWVVWDGRPRDDASYWRDFNSRYGSVANPGLPDGVPYGLKIDGDATIDCLFCHSSRVGGETFIGAAGRVDLEALYDDLVRLNDRGPDFGFPRFPVPFDLDGFTGAAGAHDAFGLGLTLAAATNPAIEPPEGCGHQRPAPWWTARVKHARYADGSARDGGHRLMMATLLAFGLSFTELQALDETFRDMDHALLSLEAPAWPFAAPDPAAVERGRGVFERDCAGCHGRYDGPDRAFPERVVPVDEVGTDPARATCFTETEATWINLSWFGRDAPMTPTGGYLAPALSGVWAAAPYFHNGSVPTLAAVLDSTTRPAAWRRAGGEAEHYDPDAVGLRFEVIERGSDPDTREGRRVYDTARPGLSATGHTYGDALDDAARRDLLAYLKTL